MRTRVARNPENRRSGPLPEEQNSASNELQGEAAERSLLHVFGLIGLMCLLGILWFESLRWDKEVNHERLGALILGILAVHGGAVLFAPHRRLRRILYVLSLILLGLLGLIELGSFFWGQD